MHTSCKAFWVITVNHEGPCLLTNTTVLPNKRVHLNKNETIGNPQTLTAFLPVSGYDAVGNYVEDGKYEEANLK